MKAPTAVSNSRNSTSRTQSKRITTISINPLMHPNPLNQGMPKEWVQCGWPDSGASQYLSSFYFIIYTMMTVGYGDQSAEPSSKKARERAVDHFDVPKSPGGRASSAHLKGLDWNIGDGFKARGCIGFES